jgi:hypothetical protein
MEDVSIKVKGCQRKWVERSFGMVEWQDLGVGRNAGKSERRKSCFRKKRFEDLSLPASTAGYNALGLSEQR